MTKFKTLIRKSDRHYMRVWGIGVQECLRPEMWDDDTQIDDLIESYPDFDWSLYQLIEVTVIPTAETCKWIYDEDELCYKTCSIDLSILNESGDLDKDFYDTGYKYCPFCGRKIERV